MPDLSVDGGETKFSFDLDEMTTEQAIAIEDEAGLTWLQFTRGLATGSAKAMRALAWILQRETDPGLDIDDVTFRVQDFAVTKGANDEVPLERDSEDSDEPTESSSTRSMESDPGSGTA